MIGESREEFEHDRMGKSGQKEVRCGQPERDKRILALTTDSSIIYYGPHPCPDCCRKICRVSISQGGETFDYPKGPVYPNTNWKLHVCTGKETVLPTRPTPGWFSTAMAVAQHEDRKRTWPWYGRFYHWALRSWRCPCCKEARKSRVSKEKWQ